MSLQFSISTFQRSSLVMEKIKIKESQKTDYNFSSMVPILILLIQ